jgi:hypothetical protein
LFLIVGVIGDAALVTWLFGALMDEAERFLGWEDQRRAGAPAQRAIAAEAHPSTGRAKR